MLTDPTLCPAFLEVKDTIVSVEVLHADGHFLIRLRSSNDRESVTAPNSDRMREALPVFQNRVAPFFVGRSIGAFERDLDHLYRHQSNYKLQGLLYWCAVAAIEKGILDLAARKLGCPIGELFGPTLLNAVSIYPASHNRGNEPEAEIDHLRGLVAESGAKALKFRLGGRMSQDQDFPADRTSRLIPMVREAFPELTLYADANSSYSVGTALRVGHDLEAHRYSWFEEPVPFDDLWGTKAVAEALEIPIAAGEQEFSDTRFRWMIEGRGQDIVQPDLHYFGGWIRSMRVARYAAHHGLPCTPHMSGSGLGFVDVIQFASVTPNAGPFQEFKGITGPSFFCPTSSLRPVQGEIVVPTGPGTGVDIDPDFVAGAEVIWSTS